METPITARGRHKYSLWPRKLQPSLSSSWKSISNVPSYPTCIQCRWVLNQCTHYLYYFTVKLCVCNFLCCRLKALGITCKSSIGSTPSCSHPVKDMAQLSEVHPGNYVFYGVLMLCWCSFPECPAESVIMSLYLFLLADVQQSRIGSCSLEDVAVRVLTRVIGHCPHRNQLLIDCGWTGLRCVFIFAQW